MPSLDEYLQIATQAAATTGNVLRDNRAKWSVVEGVDGREVKLLADREAESAALAILEPTGLPILSEEAGKVGGREIDTGDAWILDPLDGSVNYFRGSLYCAVSIALLREGRPILGVVNCFLLQEQFTGIVGQGAWLNGESMRVSNVDKASDGILQTGIPARASDDSFDVFKTRIRSFQKVRMIGSAATALAQVAAGRADAYRESGSMLWDVAGGCALVEAAGGRFNLGDGPLHETLEVAATNGLIGFPD